MYWYATTVRYYIESIRGWYQRERKDQQHGFETGDLFGNQFTIGCRWIKKRTWLSTKAKLICGIGGEGEPIRSSMTV